MGSWIFPFCFPAVLILRLQVWKRPRTQRGESPPPDSDPFNGRLFLRKSCEFASQASPDFHIGPRLIRGDKPGIVVCEIPAKKQWCSIRETVFSWTTTRFPFHTGSDRKLKLIGAPIITVTGKAYWDVGYAPKDQSNRRSHLPGYAAFEIHPVMKLTVQ
jgi:hypothetical protein